MPQSLYPARDFIHLAGRVIDELGLPRPVMQASDGDALDVALVIGGVHVSLCYEPDISAGHFLLDARIGSVGNRPGAFQHVLAENAASQAAVGASKAKPRTNRRASGAPTRRSIPASSHSIESGPP